METPQLTDKGPWGVYDCKDKCWMGKEDGPLKFDDQELARGAATIMNVMFKKRWQRHQGYRFRAFDLPPDINKHKDTVEARITAEEALQELHA